MKPPLRWIAATGIGLLLAASAVADPPKRYAPLSEQERATARAPAQARAEAAASARAARTTAPARTEVLLVERRQERKQAYKSGSWSRSADVYTYDYASDTLRHTVVDVATGTVRSEQTSQGVQLPLTPAEMERALGIAYADAATRSVLEGRYRAVAGELLESIGQLEVKAFVFHSDSKPEGLNEASRACGIHRCAQLLLFTADRVVLEVQPIVDLSAGQVTQLIGF